MRFASPMTMVAVLAVAPLAAAAQQAFAWDDYCTVGSLELCASMNLSLTTFKGSDYATGYTGTETAIGIQLQNLEGTVGSTPWAMGGLEGGIQFELTGDPNGPFNQNVFSEASLSGSAGLLVTNCATTSAIPEFNTCPTSYWGGSEWYTYNYIAAGPAAAGGRRSLLEFSPNFTGGTYLPTQVVGCDAPPQAPGVVEEGYYQTCGDGWVGFTFVLDGAWTFDSTSSATWDASTSGDYGGVPGCSFTVQGSSCVQVTPEPTTVLLLSTGLLGLGCAHLRRRRRKA